MQNIMISISYESYQHIESIIYRVLQQECTLGCETIAANYPFLVTAGGAGLTKRTLRFGVPVAGTAETRGGLGRKSMLLVIFYWINDFLQSCDQKLY